MTVTHRFLDKPCERDVLVSAIENGLRLRESLGDASVRGELGGLIALPTGESTVARLHRVMDRGDSTTDEVAAVVETDVALTVMVLSLANSTSFGWPGQETASVSLALGRLGLPTVRALTLMQTLSTPFRSEEATNRDWLNSLNASAYVAGHVARRLVSPDDASRAFSTALVEEAGQLAFASCRPEPMSRIVADARNDSGRLSRLETAEFGVEHADAGAYLLSLWGFPSGIVRAVASHADAMPTPTQDVLSVADAVRVANAVAHRTIAGVCPHGAGDGVEAWLQDPRCQVEAAAVSAANRLYSSAATS
jgi:HD-like signal output (HDOD) protein